MPLRVPSNGSRVTICNPESADSLLTRVPEGLNGNSEALSEADAYQQIFRRQELQLVLQVSFATDRSFGVKPQRDQSVCKVVRQRCSEIDPDNHNAPGSVY